MIQPATINANRKIPLTTPFKRLLFDVRSGETGGSVIWYYYNSRVLAFSNDLIRCRSDQIRYDSVDKITFTLDDDRYIRPPKAVNGQHLHQLRSDTQTVAEFLAVLFDVTQDELLDSYSPDSCYFEDRDELAEVLDEEIPRYAFFVTAEDWPVDSPVIHIFTQEQIGATDLTALKRRLAMEIIEDLRVVLGVEALCVDSTYFPEQETSFSRTLLTSVDAWYDETVRVSEPL